MNVQVRRRLFDSEHENQKWVVLEGYIEGCPAVTKVVTINTAAMASEPGHYAAKKAKLIEDVNEYYERWCAIQAQPELNNV